MNVTNEVEAILIRCGFEKHDEVEGDYVMPLVKGAKVLASIEEGIFCMEMVYSGPHLQETMGRNLVGYLKIQRPEIIQELMEGFEWLWSSLRK